MAGSASVTRNGLPGTTTASFSYSASGFSLPSSSSSSSSTGDSKNGSKTTTEKSYSNIKYSWSFTGGGTSSSQSGTTNISGLNSGSQGYFQGTVTVSCTETTKVTTETWTTPQVDKEVTEKDKDGNEVKKTIKVDGEKQTKTDTKTTTANYSLGSASDSTNYWTKPTSFSFGVSAEGIIQQTLSASKVRDFGTYVGKYKSWENQSSVAAKTYNAQSGDVITAALYNQIADDVGVSHVTGGANGTVITAALWNALAAAVS